jgi:homeodomain-containing protein
MLALLTRILRSLRSVLDVSSAREAEILVLRQQMLVLSRKSAKRARLRNIDRLILVWLSWLFPSVWDAIVIVKPETVFRWHRRGFRSYWRWKSWRRGGRPKIDRELRELIRRLSRENPLWGAPRIHGELLMLGIDVSESTVGRYMIRIGRPRSQAWKTFLRNQASGIASIDLFVVRTISSSCSMAW